MQSTASSSGQRAKPGLVVPIEVQAVTDPDLPWGLVVENPIEWEADPLVWQLWQHAVDTVGLPRLAAEDAGTE